MTEANVFESTSGGVGQVPEDLPELTHAIIRPYVIAILLHRGSIKLHEIIAAITPHVRTNDLKTCWEDNCGLDETKLELFAKEVLKEFEIKKLLCYDLNQDIWMLETDNLTTIISWVTTLNSQLPKTIIEKVAATTARSSLVKAAKKSLLKTD